MKNAYVAFVSISERHNDYLTSIEQTTIPQEDDGTVNDVFLNAHVKQYVDKYECSWARIELDDNGVAVWDSTDNMVIVSHDIAKLFKRIGAIFAGE